MIKIGTKRVEEILGNALFKSRKLKDCCIIERGIIGGNCKDDFVNREGVR